MKLVLVKTGNGDWGKDVSLNISIQIYPYTNELVCGYNLSIWKICSTLFQQPQILFFTARVWSTRVDILFSDNFDDRFYHFRNLRIFQVANSIQDNMGIGCKYAVGSYITWLL